MMFDFIVKADDLGAVPKTSTVKSKPFDNNLLVVVFLAVFSDGYLGGLRSVLVMKAP